MCWWCCWWASETVGVTGGDMRVCAAAAIATRCASSGVGAAATLLGALRARCMVRGCSAGGVGAGSARGGGCTMSRKMCIIVGMAFST